MNSSLEGCFQDLPSDGSILDVGCLGFRQVEHARSLGLSLTHAGVDRLPTPLSLPEGFVYRRADLGQEPLPFDDDTFDLVVASHVIEHVPNPIDVVAECIRVCRPGGLVYIEAPSERSLWLPGMPFWHHDLRSLSFFDDPTHTGRPWTPQALYRMARYFGCEILEARHLSSWRLRLGLPAYHSCGIDPAPLRHLRVGALGSDRLGGLCRRPEAGGPFWEAGDDVLHLVERTASVCRSSRDSSQPLAISRHSVDGAILLWL